MGTDIETAPRRKDRAAPPARRRILVDGNEAAASVAYRLSEVIAIYPITPSSPMGELADAWSAAGIPNLWGIIPQVTEMQSEGGAAGAVHGAIQGGALTTTFTASQGLLLMIPNMYKIAGELTPTVFHVAARTVATHALSIFGDHSDVYACRPTGFAMLASGSVQEAQDLAAVAHAASLETRLPFLHFFDGFRTSHEVGKIEALDDDQLTELVSDRPISDHRTRALSPDHPCLRGSAQNPDTFFQAREAINPFYDAAPDRIEEVMRRFAAIAGREYRLFDYVGHPEADRVIVMMGSGAETAHETVEAQVGRGERVGLVKVRLYRPFSLEHFRRALPAGVRRVAVLDRTKEPGAPGDPLYVDVRAALDETTGPGEAPLVVGGRYGLSSKEFTPAMVEAIFADLAAARPRNHYTVGIVDDVTHRSLHVDGEDRPETGRGFQGVFYGLGSDGTVGANKNSIKIIGDGTDQFAQGYFVYDSKKAGAVTVSHLRFGPDLIRSTYLIRRADFVACHQWSFIERMDILERAAPGGTLLLNAPYPADEVWSRLPRQVQEGIIEKGLTVWAIDAYAVAREAGLGRRINTIMQTCFFALTKVLKPADAIARIKGTIEKTYGSKGAEIVRLNFAAVDGTLERLHQVKVPEAPTATRSRTPIVPDAAPDFVQRVTGVMLEGRGDLLPVSAFPPDGTWPTGTARWEKRNIALEIPDWDPQICIQCNKCALVCPHAAIRAKVYPPAARDGAPAAFRSVPYRGQEFPGQMYSIQVAPEDCTGCTLCVEVCPAKDKGNPRHKAIDMTEQMPIRERERKNFSFFLGIPEADRSALKRDVKGVQFLEPLFEFSGACAGCGETPYVKLLTQLFGDRLLIANATGCSSIYGGNLPTTPYTTNRDGRGPAWSNSLFEDNAEFGLGIRLAVDRIEASARQLLLELTDDVGKDAAQELLAAEAMDDRRVAAQRTRVEALRRRLAGLDKPVARRLEAIADYLVQKSVWIVGGDGWAYDIGFGGLDHVLSLGKNVNILVLDTGVYSNTGGQASKATPLGATAKFAARGKESSRKDLGMMAMAYGNVYVAQIAFGAKDAQTVKAVQEAEAYPGPSLIIAYSTCIAHGYPLSYGADHMKQVVSTGMWPLYRYDPRRIEAGEPPLQLDSKPPSLKFEKFAQTETRFRMLLQADPVRGRELMAKAQREISNRFELYRQMAAIHTSVPGDSE